MFRDFRNSELRILLNSVIPSIFRKNLISDAQGHQEGAGGYNDPGAHKL